MSARGLPLLLAGQQDDFAFLLGRLQTPTLPEGVLADIMSYLDPRDVLACRLVTKAWSRAAAGAVRHLDLPCKTLAAAAAAEERQGWRGGGGGSGGGHSGGFPCGEGVDAALRRLHRVWPATESVTLSGLAAGRALSAEMSLQLLANHLSRWRNLREIELRDMPVAPAPIPCCQAAPRPPPVRTTAAPRRGGTGPPRAPAAPGGALTAAAATRRPGAAAGVGRYEGGGDASGDGASFSGDGVGGGGPGPWALGCLSCCLGLARLSLELVPLRQPQQEHPLRRSHERTHAHPQEQLEGSAGARGGERRGPQLAGWQQRLCRQQPGPARLAAGQAALLEDLTRLTRLTHLSVRLLDLDLDPDQEVELREAAAAQPGEWGAGAAAEGAAADVEESGSDGGEGSEGAAVEAGTAFGCRPRARGGAAAAGPPGAEAGAEADEYVLDAEEAGSYEADLDMDLDLDLDLDLGITLESDPGGDAASAGFTDREEAADSGAREAAAAGGGSGGPGGAGAAAPFQQPPRVDDCAARGGSQWKDELLPPPPPPPREQREQQRQLHLQRRAGHGEGDDDYGDSGASSDVSDNGFGLRGDGASDSGGDSSLSDGDGSPGGGDAGAAAAAAAVSRSVLRWVPQPALLARLGPRLRSLRLVGCELRGGGALAVLAGALTGLTSLSLQGRLGVSHRDLEALSCLRDLRDLSLSRVELLFNARDPDDCPVALMTELYGALQQLQHFQSLRFDLDASGGSGIHSAYLLPLYDSPLARLRALDLSTVVLDSDYSFHMLGELTSLTCLAMSYVTWPLALQCDDMTLLAPLTGLRRFSMHCEPSERHHLISLSGRVVEGLAGAWRHLSQLAFTGQILADLPGAPSLRSLASWTSLRDLSLTAAPDDEDNDPSRRQRHSPDPAEGEVGSGACNQATRGGRAAAAGLPYMYGGGGDVDDDEDGAAAAAAAGSLDLGVGVCSCLPPGLTRLALSGVRLRGGELLRLLAGSLTGLTSLQVLDCGLTPAHLMVGDSGATQLQVLALSDSRAWHACQSQRNQVPRGWPSCPHTSPSLDSHSLSPSCEAAAARSRSSAARPGHVPRGLPPSASASPGVLCPGPGCTHTFASTHPESGVGGGSSSSGCCHCRCRCCCSPGRWATRRCLGGPALSEAGACHRAVREAGGGGAARLAPAPAPGPAADRLEGNARCGHQLRRRRRLWAPARRASAACGEGGDGIGDRSSGGSDRDSGGLERCRHDGGAAHRGCGGAPDACSSGGDGWGGSTDESGSEWGLERGGDGTGGDGRRAGADDAAGVSAGAGDSGGRCGCWRQRLVRHGLATLASLRSLEFLVLGLPDDELAAADVLAPLAELTGLRCLTLLARGMRAATVREVSEPLGRLARLRSLHLMGPTPDSVAALGAEDAARGLPYV